jgi:hypothetical protein
MAAAALGFRAAMRRGLVAARAWVRSQGGAAAAYKGPRWLLGMRATLGRSCPRSPSFSHVCRQARRCSQAADVCMHVAVPHHPAALQPNLGPVSTRAHSCACAHPHTRAHMHVVASTVTPTALSCTHVSSLTRRVAPRCRASTSSAKAAPSLPLSAL